MATVVIEYSGGWKPNEVVEFDTIEQAKTFVDEYYSDCDVIDNGDEITVIY